MENSRNNFEVLKSHATPSSVMKSHTIPRCPGVTPLSSIPMPCMDITHSVAISVLRPAVLVSWLPWYQGVSHPDHT